MRLTSQPLLYAKPPPSYIGLSIESRRIVDRIDPRSVRPSELRELAESLHKDGAISDAQKLELCIIRKPYAADVDDSPVDLVGTIESGVTFAAGFQPYVPGSGCAAYYVGMARFVHWLDSTARLHRPVFSGWA